MTRRAQLRDRRGYFGIGIENSKTAANLGTLWRSAYCLGASFVFTIGDRYRKQATDTVQSWKHVPFWRFSDVADFHSHLPYDCQVIGIELRADAQRLETFSHPERAIYLLGPEDGSLSEGALAVCQQVVAFDSAYCLNVASAGTVVLYDRQTKRGPVVQRSARRPVTAEVAGSNPVGTAS